MGQFWQKGWLVNLQLKGNKFGSGILFNDQGFILTAFHNVYGNTAGEHIIEKATTSLDGNWHKEIHHISDKNNITVQCPDKSLARKIDLIAIKAEGTSFTRSPLQISTELPKEKDSVILLYYDLNNTKGNYWREESAIVGPLFYQHGFCFFPLHKINGISGASGGGVFTQDGKLLGIIQQKRTDTLDYVAIFLADTRLQHLIPQISNSNSNFNNSSTSEQHIPSITFITFDSPKIIDIGVNELKALIPRVEILLLTVNDWERKALLSEMTPIDGRDGILQGALDKLTYRIGMFGNYCAAYTESTMSSSGRQGATLTTKIAVDELKPKAVLLLGIAFGIDSSKQKLGDVLIAESIQPYEFQKVNNDFSITYRGQATPCGNILSERFRMRRSDWTPKYGDKSFDDVKVHQGLVLSGDKLVNNKDFRDALVKAFPTAIGGEMEGAGAYSAVSSPVEVILIKSICDWADGDKNDKAQPFAAFTATSLAKHVLSKPDVLFPLIINDNQTLENKNVSVSKKKNDKEKPTEKVPAFEVSSPAIWVLVAGTGGIMWHLFQFKNFCIELGKALAGKRYGLITCGWPGVDLTVTKAFSEQLKQDRIPVSDYLKQVIPKGKNPSFFGGQTIFVQRGVSEYVTPIKMSRGVILIGGYGGTTRTYEIACQQQKPVFPIPFTKAAAREIYDHIIKNWSASPLSSITKDDFIKLNNPINTFKEKQKVITDLFNLIDVAITNVAAQPQSQPKISIKPNQKAMTMDRKTLYTQLSALVPAQFNQLLIEIDPPAGLIPPPSASQADRAFSLWEWAKSPSGCGLTKVQEILETILNPLLDIPQSQSKAEQLVNPLISKQNIQNYQASPSSNNNLPANNNALTNNQLIDNSSNKGNIHNMVNPLVNNLKEQISHKKVFLFIGTGVSISASGNAPVASWKGLLKNGAELCNTLCNDLPNRWKERVLEDIESSDITDLLSAAEKIQIKLKSLGGQYSRWLRETVGQLQIVDLNILNAIKVLDLPVITTNYDNLLEKALGLREITWMDERKIDRFFQGEEKGIFHLHGHWDHPESVILGIRDYQNILNAHITQSFMQSLRLGGTLVFIGYGAGLQDPNFKAFLDYGTNTLRLSEAQHYRLIKEDERSSFTTYHPNGSGIFPIVYGSSHDDLVPFLQSLNP